mgnify:CR=1 FL=1
MCLNSDTYPPSVQSSVITVIIVIRILFFLLAVQCRHSCLIFAAALAAASPLTQHNEMILKHSLGDVPNVWELKQPAPADLTINMHIQLKEENLHKLQQRVLEISDPDHEDYGKHMSKGDINALTAPTNETIDIVTSWLASHGVDAGKLSNGFMPVAITVAQAKALLGAEYGVYNHAKDQKHTVRAMQYSLPQKLHQSIVMVQPTTLFSDLGMSKAEKLSEPFVPDAVEASRNVARSDIPLCDRQGTSPECLGTLYNIQGYTPQSGQTTLGITGFIGEDPSTDDLAKFLAKYTSIPADATYSVETINNGLNSNAGTEEANLDVQYSMALTYPIDNIFYSTSGQPPFNPDTGSPTNTNEPHLDGLNYMADLDSVPETISSSYSDDEQTVPKDYADAVCGQYMKLAARGVSVLIASGDHGAAGRLTTCLSNDGSENYQHVPTCNLTTLTT